MKSINSIQIEGNLGKNPDIKTFEGGSKIAMCSMCVNNGYYNKQNEWIERDMWIYIKFRGARAEDFVKRCVKGQRILVTGSLESRTFGEEGDKKVIFEVNGDNFRTILKNTNGRNEEKKIEEGDGLPF